MKDFRMKQSAFTPNPFYEAALAIARRKLSRDANPQLLRSPRLGTGGDFVNIFLWDTAFSVQWAKFHADEFPVADSLDNFYALQSPDGFISRESCPDGTSRCSPGRSWTSMKADSSRPAFRKFFRICWRSTSTTKRTSAGPTGFITPTCSAAAWMTCRAGTAFPTSLRRAAFR